VGQEIFRKDDAGCWIERFVICNSINKFSKSLLKQYPVVYYSRSLKFQRKKALDTRPVIGGEINRTGAWIAIRGDQNLTIRHHDLFFDLRNRSREQASDSLVSVYSPPHNSRPSHLEMSTNSIKIFTGKLPHFWDVGLTGI
jgi:hypothetical protein